jgi:UDP-N-acetylglucosamine 3-dehydrogenase
MTSLQVGLVGLGAMGRNHARVIAAVDGMDLVGVHDPALEADTYNGIPVFTSADSLLASGLDCCVIAAPTSEHEHLASTAADHGVSVLVEKPLASNTAAADRMTSLFAERGLVGVVGHIERFNPASIALHERLVAGQLGTIYQVATRRQGPFPARIRDVGVVMDLATHDIDLTRWATESPYRRIGAFTGHRSGRRHEDLVVASGVLESGAVFSHHVNWISSAKERLTVVTGEGGTLIADTLNADLWFHENALIGTDWEALQIFRGVGEGNVIRYALERREPLLAEIEAFRDAVRGDAAPAVPFRDGADVVRIAEAMLDAAKTGRIVDLDEATG